MGKISKEDKQFREFIKKTIAEMQKEHSLGDYSINVVEHMDHDGKWAAKMRNDLDYYESTLELWPTVRRSWKNKDYALVRLYIAHELAHIRVDQLSQLITSPFKTEEMVNRENERLTEILGRLMYHKTYGTNDKINSGAGGQPVRKAERKPRRRVRKQSVRSVKRTRS